MIAIVAALVIGSDVSIGDADGVPWAFSVRGCGVVPTFSAVELPASPG
jgi:hypothetical protein